MMDEGIHRNNCGWGVTGSWALGMCGAGAGTWCAGEGVHAAWTRRYGREMVLDLASGDPSQKPPTTECGVARFESVRGEGQG